MYESMRKCRRDGNCFYRAFAFGLIVSLSKLNEKKISDIITLICFHLDKSNYQQSAYEDFLDAFIEDIKACQGSDDTLCSRWKANEYGSQSAVMLLRLLTSSYIQSNESDFIAFISDDIIVDDKQKSPISLYCQRNVECMGIESDQIHIVALCSALRTQVNIIYLDNSFSDATAPLVIGQDSVVSPHDLVSNIPFPLANINMLYRPGHYDLIYPRN